MHNLLYLCLNNDVHTTRHALRLRPPLQAELEERLAASEARANVLCIWNLLKTTY